VAFSRFIIAITSAFGLAAAFLARPVFFAGFDFFPLCARLWASPYRARAAGDWIVEANAAWT
jgi:hypothetical protein